MFYQRLVSLIIPSDLQFFSSPAWIEFIIKLAGTCLAWNQLTSTDVEATTLR